METPWIQDVLVDWGTDLWWLGGKKWVFFVFWQSPADNESCGAATSESQQDDSLQVGFCESNITETKSLESIV